MAYGITFETSKVDTVLSIVSLFCYANDYQDMQKRWEQQVTGVQPQGEDVQYVVIGGLDHTLQKELLEFVENPPLDLPVPNVSAAGFRYDAETVKAAENMLLAAITAADRAHLHSGVAA